MGSRPAFSKSDLDLIEQACAAQSRRSLWAYRQFMRPKMKRSWWQRDLCQHLQLWFDDLNAGKRPFLFVEAPPQHGKSETVIDALSWMLGHRPDLMTFFASYSDRLGTRSNPAAAFPV